MKHTLRIALLFVAIATAGCGATTETNNSPSGPGETDEIVTVGRGEACGGKVKCGGTDICVNNVCVEAPPVDNRKTCDTSATCNSTERCIKNKCTPLEDICKIANITCGQYYECRDGACIPTCNPSVMCGGSCCNDTQTCFNNSSCIVAPKKSEKSGDVLCETQANTPQWCDVQQGCFVSKTDPTLHACKPLANECDEKESFCRIVQYCDKGYGRCVAYDDNPGLCLVRPPFGKDPKTILYWNGSTFDSTDDTKKEPTYNQVMSAPAVANIIDNNGDGKLDDNDTSEIIFTTFHPSDYNDPGVLRVISGEPDPADPKNVKEFWNSRSVDEPFWTSANSTPAIGDINGDGKPDIIVDAYDAPGTAGRKDDANHKLIALNADGTRIWTQEFGKFYPHTWRWKEQAESFGNSGPMLVDLDHDGNPEIIALFIIYDHEGNKICELKEDNEGVLLDKAPLVHAAIDFNHDGTMELVTNRGIYAYEAQSNGRCKQLSLQTQHLIGAISVADLDKDGQPELVGISGTEGIIIENVDPNTFERTTKKVIKVPLPSDPSQTHNVDCSLDSNKGKKQCIPGGGLPNIADFDGDGYPEIGVAGRYYYIVARENGEILWAHRTTDYSSAATSSSVFDFDGDGKAEVVYNDEYKMRIYSGTGTGVDSDGDGFNDADIRVTIPNPTWTLREYPVIADVNHDGHANIVLAANNYGRTSEPTGIRVFADADNNWVPTRNIWNQFAYHVTNVNDDGSIPTYEKENWTLPWLNNALQNVQAGNPFLAPNLKPVIQYFGNPGCSPSSVEKTIIFDVENVGDREVTAGSVGYKVTATRDTETVEIATGTTQTVIGPKGKETVEVTWTMPDTWKGKKFSLKVTLDEEASVEECKEDDNVVVKENLNSNAPNLVVNVNTAFCGPNNEEIVTYEISNTGNASADAGTVVVRIYGGVTGGDGKLLDEITLSEALPVGETVAKTFNWSVPSEFHNRPLKIRIVIDEQNEIFECNEDDNKKITDGGVCYLFL